MALAGRVVTGRVGEVETYLEGEALYVEAPYGADPRDIEAALGEAEADGYLPQDQDFDEETEDGIRVRLLRRLTAQKKIPGLLSTPLLLGMGAMAAQWDNLLPTVFAVIG